MSEQPLVDYFAALERLKKGKPTVVSKGTRITNDSVALEAGRGKGSIKKSRSIFTELIQAIDDAFAEQANPAKQHKDQIERSKSMADQFRLQYEAAIGREVSLLHELFELRKNLGRLTGEKVLPLRGTPLIQECGNPICTRPVIETEAVQFVL